MNYADVLEALKKASLFDLWRLNAAIRHLLENPHKQNAIKVTLHPGQSVQYFSGRENCEVSGHIVEIKRNRVLVKSARDQKIWAVPFYMLNLQGIDTAISSSDPRTKLDRNSVKVGDRVGYKDRNQRDVYGTVIKLNPKTATIKIPTGEVWLVYYEHLFAVFEGETACHNPTYFIEGEIVSADD